MSLLTDDPAEVWAYFESSATGDPVYLPVEVADSICADCRYLIPDTPMGCCWRCTWDLTGQQEEEYQILLLDYEDQLIAELF